MFGNMSLDKHLFYIMCRGVPDPAGYTVNFLDQAGSKFSGSGMDPIQPDPQADSGK